MVRNIFGRVLECIHWNVTSSEDLNILPPLYPEIVANSTTDCCF